MKRCRLCLSDCDNYYSLSEKREGLPISVLAMIICPIKIEQNDNLPKNICEECLEVVLSAYKLRDVSSRSDRYLREDEDIQSENYVVKEEKTFEDTCALVYTEPLKILNQSGQVDFSNDIGLYVDCSKSMRRSYVWQFFGNLCDSNGGVIDSDYNYCSICVESGLLRKYKNIVSTSALLNHLKNHHEIDGHDEKIPQNKSEAPYVCDICGSSFGFKSEISRHMIQKHTKADKKSLLSGTGYTVNCYDHKKSFAWQFFGDLCNTTGDIEDDDYHYCSLCVAKGVLKKYKRDVATNGLLYHLLKQHKIQDKESKIDKTQSMLQKTYVCDTCGVCMSKKIEMKHHINQQHGCTSKKLTFYQRFDEMKYTVDCCRKQNSRKASVVWEYFGKLKTLTGADAKEGYGYIFCKLCAEESNILHKFSSTTATSSLARHIESKHNTLANPEESQSKEVSVNDFSVNCCKELSSRSFVWKYMGTLTDSKGKPIKNEAGHYFCKLCVEQGVLTKKFKRSCATSTYSRHLNKSHGITNTEADGFMQESDPELVYTRSSSESM